MTTQPRGIKKPAPPKRPAADPQTMLELRVMPLIKRVEQLCKVHGIAFLHVYQVNEAEVLPSWHIPESLSGSYTHTLVQQVHRETDDGGDEVVYEDEGGNNHAS